MHSASTSRLPPEADRVLISVNPTAGARSSDELVARLCDLLAQRGLQAEVLTDLAEVSGQANCWHREGRLRALVGAGGDGTAAELVNRTEPGVPITMIPGGTANLLAYHFGMRKSPEAICETIVGGRVLHLDAAKAGERVFLLMFSCGFDAEVVQRLHEGRRGHIRQHHYAWPIVRSLCSYRFPEIEVYCDESEGGLGCAAGQPISAGWVFAFNLPCYGGGFRLAPRADGGDGLLDVCLFRRRSFWHGLRFVAAVTLRRHEQMSDCRTGRLRRLRLSSSEPVPYQLDGDPGGFLPLEIKVLPERLALVVPAEKGRMKNEG